MDAQTESSECRSPLPPSPSLWRTRAGDSECSPLREERDWECLFGVARCFNPRSDVVQRGLKHRATLSVAVLIGLLLASCSAPRVLFEDRFTTGLSNWVIEQQPGGTVTIENGALVIADEGGCTVWFKQRLEAPVVISYTATVSSKARVSDLNCFWMATDPARPADLIAPGHARTGAFATYDNLRTYYAGYGGNANTTTRFRRYAGDGSKPLLPEHDLSAPVFMLKADHPYRIELVVVGSRVQYLRDGELVFDFTDPEPLASGWFGFRTVKSRIEIRDFQVRTATSAHLLERK